MKSLHPRLFLCCIYGYVLCQKNGPRRQTAISEMRHGMNVRDLAYSLGSSQSVLTSSQSTSTFYTPTMSDTVPFISITVPAYIQFCLSIVFWRVSACCTLESSSVHLEFSEILRIEVPTSIIPLMTIHVFQMQNIWNTSRVLSATGPWPLDDSLFFIVPPNTFLPIP